VKDCLNYNKFKYESHEWDNVAPVLARFNIHLEKYLEGIAKECKEISGRENIEELRAYAESGFLAA
jgi:hypothetical protein